MADIVPLGDLISIRRGTTYKSALLGRPGPYLLGLASIARNGGFRSDSLKTYGGESPESLLVRPGELFASLKDVTQAADLLGSVARLPHDEQPGRLTQDTVRLDVVSDRVDRDYLYWLLRTPKYREYCRAHATGTTNLGLPRDDFLGFPVRLPSLGEQRRIAEVLGALDDLIDTNNRLIEKSKSLSTTLFSSMLEERVQCRLGDIADVNPTKVKPKSSGELIYLDIASLGNGSISWPDPISWAEAPGRARRGASVGSTLWSNVRPNRLGHALLLHAPDNLVVSTGISVLEPRDVGPAELHEITQTEAFVAHLVARSDGSAYPAVTASVFEDAPVERLSAADSERFEAIAWPLWESVAQLENENEQLRHTCDELLPSLMSGAVRVRPEGVTA